MNKNNHKNIDDGLYVQLNMVLTVSSLQVRFALLSSDYINMNVRTNELVNSNLECWQLLEDASLIKETMSRCDPPLCAVRNYLARPRLPKAILLAIGGCTYNRDTLSHVEAFDVRMNRWLLMSNEHRPRAYHGTAFLDGYIYCLGGQDLQNNVNNILNSVERFDLSTQTWDQVSPMRHQRCYVTTAVLDGFIYALGGLGNRSHLSTAERYRPETNQWSLIASMGETRRNASCTTLHNKVMMYSQNGHLKIATFLYLFDTLIQSTAMRLK